MSNVYEGYLHRCFLSFILEKQLAVRLVEQMTFEVAVLLEPSSAVASAVEWVWRKPEATFVLGKVRCVDG